jgi:trehalose 6-phosphate phosphatase
MNFYKAMQKKTKEAFTAFDKHNDYLQYVDGKPRYEGIESFLDSRNIKIPWGEKGDSEEKETVCGLANKKNKIFLKELHEHGVTVYKTTVDLIKALRRAKIKTAVISSSKNCTHILEKIGILDLFDTKIDGIDAEHDKIAGKPAPDIFLEAAKRLGATPDEAVVVEDAISGVQAGKSGHFSLVIGVDRANQADALKAHGASVVVTDLSEVEVVTTNFRPS